MKEGKIEELVVPRFYTNINHSYWYTQHETLLGGK